MAEKKINCNKNPNHQIEERFAQTHYLVSMAKKGQFDPVTGQRRIPMRVKYIPKEQFEQFDYFGSFRLFDVEILHNPTLPAPKKRTTKTENND